MRRPPKSKHLWPWVQYFLEVHLPGHRGFSPNTIDSYRTAFRKLRDFLNRDPKPKTGASSPVLLESLKPMLILDFLDWLEQGKGRPVSIATRNQRLAALRSLFAFLELYCDQVDPILWKRLRKLPFKRTRKARVDYLEANEMALLLQQVPREEQDGFRDFTLLSTLYNTGARVSEMAILQKSDLMLTEPPTIRLLGKGNKVRICPLWPDAAQLLQSYLKNHRRRPLPGHEYYVFINQRGQHLTRFGIGRIVKKYLKQAAQQNEKLVGKRLSTHSIRHSTAIHLLQAGAELNVIRTWLGHASMSSTSHYLDLNLETQRDMLTKFTAPPSLTEPIQIQAKPEDSSKDDLAAWLEKL